MPFLSGAEIKSTAPTTWSSGNGFAYDGPGVHPLGRYLTDAYAYELVYERQLWAQVAINKLLWLQLLLPMKVYQRAAQGREDARDTPFGQLIAKPSQTIDPVTFWGWFILQRHIHGRAFARKIRDAGGRPATLQLIHPTRMRFGPRQGTAAAGDDRDSRWWYCPPNGGAEVEIARTEFIYWRRPSPRHPELALSMLEQLRDTLELEAAAKTATKAIYNRGGKHSMILQTPKNFGTGSSAVLQRLADQYQARHGGVDNWGRPLILEDGMTAIPLDHSPEDLQYIEARHLNREEVAAAADIPPPAIGILDRATFSNVTEQNRMLYRLTMPPILQSFESVLNFDLRDGRHGDQTRPPDFSDQFYMETLVDGVLRGSTEERIAANAQAIQTGQLSPAEAREMENRPFIEGSDRLFVNTAMAPLTQDGGADPATIAKLSQQLYLGTPEKVVMSVDEARAVLNLAGAGLAGPAPGSPKSIGAGTGGSVPAGPGQRRLTAATVQKVMGRLSRPADLGQVDPGQLVAGLDEGDAGIVTQAMDHVADLGGDVAGLRRLIKTLGAEQL